MKCRRIGTTALSAYTKLIESRTDEYLQKVVNKNYVLADVSGQLLFSPDDIERIVNAKSVFNGKQFRKMFEEK